MLLVRLMALSRSEQRRWVTRIDDGQRDVRIRYCWESGPIVRIKRAADGNPPGIACQFNHRATAFQGSVGGVRDPPNMLPICCRMRA